MELPAEVIEGLLEHHPIARLATVGADGRPHLVPVVFALYDGDLWTPIDGKPKSGRELARVRNIRDREWACLLLDAYEADWSRLWWLRVDGRAAVVEGRDPRSDPHLASAIEALRSKYPQYDAVALFRDAPVLLRVTVGRVTSWCAGAEAVRAAAGRP